MSVKARKSNYSSFTNWIFHRQVVKGDRLCGLVVRVSDFLRGSRSGRGPLSLVRTTEELLGRKK
jgi:hypothetical protein